MLEPMKSVVARRKVSKKLPYRGKAGDDCRDRLDGGSGEDLLKGGAGNDVINAKEGESDRDRRGFGDDRATVVPTDAVKACENVS
jgi:hypothetical protein